MKIINVRVTHRFTPFQGCLPKTMGSSPYTLGFKAILPILFVASRIALEIIQSIHLSPSNTQSQAHVHNIFLDKYKT